MRVVHFSDWHGQRYQLPPADLYVCTGDMLPDGPAFGHRNVAAPYQEQWVRDNAGAMREHFGDPRAPVVYVRGNHDFVDYPEYFGGDVRAVQDPGEVHQVLGLRVAGLRGVPPICGFWSDELTESQIAARCHLLPDDLDVLVTHCPPRGVLDSPHRRFGSRALRKWIDRRRSAGRAPRFHLFGHIHEDCGEVSWPGITFSNAATSHRFFDL